MTRVYSREAVEIIVKEQDKEDIKDVATALVEEIQKQNVKLSIDTAALFSNLMIACGYVPEEYVYKEIK